MDFGCQVLQWCRRDKASRTVRGRNACVVRAAAGVLHGE